MSAMSCRAPAGCESSLWLCRCGGTWWRQDDLFVLTEDETLYLLVTYPKVDKDDLSKAELKLFKTLVKELTDG
jgi:hypothetical protein